MDSGQSPDLEALKGLLDRMASRSKGRRVSPHKYILLLAVAALVQRHKDHGNRFTFEELEPIFASQFERHCPTWPSERRHLEYPYYHMQSDGCWHLHLKPGQEEAYRQYEQTRLTRKRLIETVAFAHMDGDFLNALSSEEGQQLVEQRLAALIPTIASAQQRDDQLRGGQLLYTASSSGTSLFAHEEHAIQVVRHGIPGSARLLSNVEIYDVQSNSYYEYDLIIAARSGLYVVELKHWSGHVRVAPYQWVLDDYRHRPDPHRINSVKCKLLKNLYGHQFPTFPRVWVESVVVLTHPDAVVENADSPAAAVADGRHNPTFASIDDLLSYLRKRDGAPGGQMLTDREIGAVMEYLQRLARPPRQNVYSIPGYETVQFLIQRPDRIELLARPVDGQTRGLSRFRVFRMPEVGTPMEKARARLRAENTLVAVARIGDHPNIHRVWRVPSEEGDLIEGSDWSEPGTLRDLLADRMRELTVDEALEVCRGIASALVAAHQAGIIHRAVKPEHVLLMNGIPKLTDFDLSFHLDRKVGDVTVLPDPSGLKDDGYTAPELLAGEDFDEGVDLFGLGVIAYELLGGERPFATARQLIAEGGRLRRRQLDCLAGRGVPARAIEAIQAATVADSRERLRDARAMADAFSESSPDAAQTSMPNARLNPGDRWDVFEILEFLGEGAEAQLYRARTIRGEIVALKLFNREVPQEAIFRQQEYARGLRSAHIVRSEGRLGHWGEERFFLVMEYVAGETLRERIRRGDRPDLESFSRVALGLMDALEAFHTHRTADGEAEPLVHGDVKPDNILMTQAGEAKLTDLSVAGGPRIDEFAGTVGYVPPDRILGAEMQFSADGDLFALGVTLWEWLFGGKPYANPAVGDAASVPGELVPDWLRRWRRWLERAVATREADRFASVQEMRKDFEAARVTEEEAKLEPMVDEAEPQDEEDISPETAREQLCAVMAEQDNSFVAYLRTLSNASAGNENATAEAQSSNPFYERIHVHNPVAELVRERLLDRRQNVILTGNAGDGKTTIATEVYRELTGQAMPTAKRIEVPEQRLVIVKDMSELVASRRAHVIEEAAANQDFTYLIVTNTGTLLQSARQSGIYGQDQAQVVSELLRALEADDIVPVLGDRFVLLNVGRVDSIGTACTVFEKMLAQDNWLACAGCRLSDHCPVWANVRLIREYQETVVERVKLAYARLYEYGVRLTMRQMIGHLAYALTAGRDCGELHSWSQTALEEALTGSLFFNRFFGDDGTRPEPEAMQLHPVRYLREAEFGVMLHPRCEQEIWNRGGLGAPLVGRAADILRRVRGHSEAPGAAARQQVRRLVYFFAALEQREARREYLSTFLRSPMLCDYLEIVKGSAIQPHRELGLRCRVMQVLQEFFAAVPLPEGTWQVEDRLYITLNRRALGANTQVVLACFATDDFRVSVEPGHRSMAGNGRLALRRVGGKAKLLLDLPFLDYVSQRYEGEIAAQLSAYYADRLERFGAQLLAERPPAADDGWQLHLLRIGAGRRLSQVRIHFSGDQMEVS